MTGREVQLVAYPRGEVEQSDFHVVEVPVAEPREGEVLVRNTWTSVDAGLRLRVREKQPEGYFPAFPLRQAMDGIMTVGEVVESRAAGFSPGDTVWHASGWRDYAVVQADKPSLGGLGTLRRLDVSETPASAYLGVLGGTASRRTRACFGLPGFEARTSSGSRRLPEPSEASSSKWRRSAGTA